MKKKILMAVMLIVSAALLVAASVLGTFAFLASSTAVSNTFTVGDVAIQMYETKTDKDGKPAETGQKTSDGNSYELIPGKEYLKDPTIYVKAGSTPSYLFVKIKNGIAPIEEGYVDTATIDENTQIVPTTMRAQMVAHGWQPVKANSETGEELFLYVGFGTDGKTKATHLLDMDEVSYKTVGSATDESYDIFQNFKIAQSANVADYAGAKVTLTAFAIQLEGYKDAVDGLQGYQRAWNAIVGRFTFEAGTVFQNVDGDSPSDPTEDSHPEGGDIGNA